MYRDTSKSHTIRDKNKKKQAEKYIFLFYKSDKKLTHLNKEYEKISNSTKVIFVKNLQIVKKRDTTTKQIIRQQNETTKK